MPEANQIAFRFKEIVELLVKKQEIHDGIWGIYVKFGIKAMNVGSSDETLMPTAMVPVAEIGLQKMETENNLSINAAVVNPRSKTASNANKSVAKRKATRK